MKKYEDLEIRCPRLGGQITLAYCLQERGDLPCQRIIACWEAFFPVEAWLKKRLSAHQWDRCFNELPKDRVSVIFDAVEAARKRE